MLKAIVVTLTGASNTRPTDLIIDVSGYFAAPGSTGGLYCYPVTPYRAVDTRLGRGKAGSFGPLSLAAYASRDFPLQSSGCGIPSIAQAYSLNMTAVTQGLSFLSAWPTGLPYPRVSTLNAPNGVVAGNPTDLIVDINGYSAPLTR